MSAATTRRRALRSAAVTAGALAAPALLTPQTARAQEGEDDDAALEDYVIEAIALEQVTVIAHETAAGELGGGIAPTLERLAEQDRAHARALRSALDSLGVDLPDAPSGPDDAGAIEGIDQLDDDRAAELVDLLAGIGEADGREAALEHLLDLELELLDLHLREAPGFVAADLVRVGAEIAGCEAQHVVILREALGTAPAAAVPDLGPARGAERDGG